MKKLFQAGFLGASLFLAQSGQGQGTTYVSTLQQTPIGTLPVASDAWLAASFTTGASPGGYTLEAIHLLMGASSGSASGFSITIYNSDTIAPENMIGSLIGVDPTAAGTFSYVADNLFLSPSTIYWFAVTASTPATTGSFNWNYFNPPGPITENNWTINRGFQGSSDGVNWGRAGFTFQFAVSAAPVPEPSVGTLLFLGGVFFSGTFLRRIRR